MSSKLDILITASNEASGPINQIKKSLGGLGTVAGTTIAAAGAASIAAVAGITAVVADGVSKAAEMEQRVADIASVMGKSADEVQPLSNLISQLGIDPKLKVDATEAADAIEMLARNGVSMQEILDGAARSTVLLANATGADFATSADVATDVMSLFGIEADNMKQAVDGIYGVTSNSKFSMDDYALALAQGGGVAAAAGVEFEDFNTTIAAISPYFGSGSDAGTSFKTMLQRLIPGSKDATAAMKELGLMTEDGANQFYDANGQLKSMSEISKLLNTALAGLSEEQKNAALNTIFGSDAIRAANALAEAGAGSFDQLKTSMAGVNSEASAATRMNTFSGQMEILQGLLDGLVMQIGQAFLPMLRELANWATDFVDQNGAAIVEWFSQLAEWIQVVTPIALEFAKTFFGALGELGAWVSGQQTDFANLKNIWNGFTEAVNAAVQAIIGYVQVHWPEWVAALQEWAKAAWEWIVDEGAPNAVKALGEWAIALFGELKANLPTFLKMLFEWGKELFTWISEAIPRAIRGISEFIISLADSGTKEGGDSFGQMAGKWLHTLIDWIWSDLIPLVGPAFLDFLKVALSALGNIALEFAIAGAKLGVTILTSLAEALLNMVGINVSLNELRNNIFNFIDNLRGPVREKAAAMTMAIGQGIQQGAKWSSDRWSEFMGILHKHLDDGLQMSDFVAIGADLVSWMVDGVKSMWNALPDELKNTINSAFQSLMGAFNFDTWRQIGAAMMDGIKQGFTGKIDELRQQFTEFAQSLPEWVKGPLGINSPSKVFEGLGYNIMQGLSRGIADSALMPAYAMSAGVDALAASATNTNYYNTYNVNVSGTGNAANDVMSNVQLLQMMYS